MVAYHPGGVIVRPNPDTILKAYATCGFVPQLGLPIHHEGWLAYLVMEALVSPSPWRDQDVATSCFLIYSLAFLFLLYLEVFYPSCVILKVLPFFLFSEYSISFIIILFSFRV
jgi:hypothetical protein